MFIWDAPEIDVEWTIELVRAVQAAALKAGLVPSLKQLPMSQWLAKRALDKLKAQFEDGNKTALMEAVVHCAMHFVPIPDWAATACIEGYWRSAVFKKNRGTVFLDIHTQKGPIKHQC